MGFGHAVYRDRDPRSAVLREVAERLGGDRIAAAIEVEQTLLGVLREAKPDRVFATNVEYYAAVVLERCGLPRHLFTPTFAAARTVGWVAHAVEQAATRKIIRPSARYTGPGPDYPEDAPAA